MSNLRIAGVFAYSGNPGPDASPDERRIWGRKEGELAVAVAGELRAAGLPCETVSVAGTPSAPYAAAVDGVSEVRPGTYVFYDAASARRAVCDWQDCALFVRATVVSKPSPDRVVIDAGSKVLTTESRPVAGNSGNPGYASIVEAPLSFISKLWEEHAVLVLDEVGMGLEVGDVINLIPFHVCPTVNLADHLYGFRGEFVETVLNVDARGCST